MSVNKVILIGNLGSEVELRNTGSGKQVASFSLATSEQYKDKTTGEKKSDTTWHNIVLWNGLAEIASKYLKKGSKAYIEGKIKTRSYESGNGEKKYITEIIGDNLTLLGDKPHGHASQVVDGNRNYANNDKDDLPF